MSEMSPEGGGGSNVFTRKIGPLSMWVWMALVLLVAGSYYLLRKKSGTNAQQGAATNNTPGGVDSSLVPQFVNQTYVQNSPPPAPNVTVNDNDKPPPTTLSETLSKGHVVSPSHKKATVGWSLANVGAQGATQLKIQLNGPGQKDIHPITRYVPASATSATFDNLLKGHNYNVTVTPVDAKGKVVGQTGNIDLKTT